MQWISGVWHYSKHGSYTVASAYHLARTLTKQQDAATTCTSSTVTVQNWTHLWNAKLQNTIKYFGWRLLHNILPNMSTLKHRHMTQNNTCSLCADGEETNLHLFRDCPYARLTWALLNIPSNAIFHSDNEWDWILSTKSRLDIKKFSLFLVTCWSIWYARNKLLHEQVHISPLNACHFVQNYIHQYWDAVRIKPIRPSQQETVFEVSAWEPPPHGYVKVNFFAATGNASIHGGVGAVVRDSDGKVLAWIRKKVSGHWSAEAVEAIAARIATYLGVSMNIRNVIIECDNLCVINQIMSPGPCLSPVGVFLQEIKEIGASLDSFQAKFIKRDANRLAHDFSNDAIGLDVLPFDYFEHV